MSDFRKSALTVAVGALLSASAAMAQLGGVSGVPLQNNFTVAPNVPVQNLICNVNAVPLTVRTEGYTELLGDVRLTCNGALQINSRNWRVGVDTAQAAPLPQLVNISVTLSTPVTSRNVQNSMTEALLFIGGANGEEATNPLGGTAVTNQNPCPALNVNSNGVCSVLAALDGTDNSTPTPGNSRPTAVGINAGNASTTASNPINVFQGQLQNANTVVFLAVPISQVDSSQNPNIANQLNLVVLALSPNNIANNALYAGQAIVVPFTKSFRIKNLRGAIPGAAAPNGQVFAFLSIQNPPANLQLNSASAVVGFVQQGLTFTRRNTANDGDSGGIAYAQCEDINRNLAVDATSGSFGNSIQGGMLLRYREGYANSFKIRGFLPGQSATLDQNNPTQIYNTESGFYNQNWAALPNTIGASSNGRGTGVADSGTRLRAAFGTVPANIRLYVSVANTNTAAGAGTMGAYGVVSDVTGGNQSPITVPVFPTSGAYDRADNVVRTTFGGSAALVPFTGGLTGPAGSPFGGITAVNAYIQVVPVSGAVSFTWEVYSADPSNPEDAFFQVVPAWRFSQNPALGSATVQGSFAPVNANATSAGFGVPIPRFQDTSAPALLFRLDSCVTNLLYPFVTNIAPFDTGIAISNTSLSDPGTGNLFPSAPSTQQGACSINYFGFTGTGRGAAPAPATSGVIPAGQTLVFTLSAGGGAPFGNIPATPGFQGYIIAQCAFRYAHGYAFISDLGATQLAQGYLALVMDAALGTRTSNSSESLSN